MERLDSIQKLLHEIKKRLGSALEVSVRLGISQKTIHRLLETSDSNFSRCHPRVVQQIVNLALELGISRLALPDDAQRLLLLTEKRVFLCHSSEDKDKVRCIYARLLADAQNPWMDEEDIQSGKDWQTEVEKAIRESVAVVVCLSNSSVGKTGFVQKEIRIALDAAQERPEVTIFIIPVRLENCDVPQRLKHLQWIDLFEPLGYQRLLKSLIEVRDGC